MSNNPRIEFLNALLKDNPGDSFVLFALGKEHQNAGEPLLALQFFEKLSIVDPNYTGLYFHLTKLYYELGQIENAVRISEKGIQITREQGDQHAFSELNGLILELGLDEEV
ncbi:MAG: tetratricopeptide repeat protein [Saprospiraceae bacterium]|jgi:tetratricopeptide (TPR) repeat protein|nr:tetratricopeptide repeat protein [Saprospiraceae bacterium]